MTLRSTISTPDGKRRYVRRLFATIADRYDFITGFLSYGQDRRWKRRLIELAALTPGDRVLDLACGTGDLLFAAAERAKSAVGLDLTHRMLQLAAQRRSVPPGLVTGDMLALPFSSTRFTVVTVGYGLRNVPDLDGALREIHRVLVPGGRLLLLDHIASTWPPVHAAQWLLERLTIRTAGEHFTRRQLPLVRAAGFDIVEVERLKAGTIERVFARKPLT